MIPGSVLKNEGLFSSFAKTCYDALASDAYSIAKAGYLFASLVIFALTNILKVTNDSPGGWVSWSKPNQAKVTILSMNGFPFS